MSHIQVLDSHVADLIAAGDEQVSFVVLGAKQAAVLLRLNDLVTLTPMEALNLVFELKKLL